jgi:ABC-type spermidine/putrescine transport system permease subunit II
MIAPFFIIYALFLLWPVIGALWSSLFDTSLGVTDGGFRGLGNYGELLGDGDFWASMWHTLLFTLLSTPPLVILALGLALLVNRALPAQWLFRLAFFAPYVLPVSVAVLLFNWLMQPGFGLINNTLVQLGFAEVGWLSEEGVAMISVVILTVWWTLGFNFVLYIAALQDIPKEIYEAAAVDGATDVAADEVHRDPAAGAHDDARARPPGDRVPQGLRPDLPAPAGRAELLDTTSGAVHLRVGVHPVPGGLRLGPVDRLLPGDHPRLLPPVRAPEACAELAGPRRPRRNRSPVVTK